MKSRQRSLGAHVPVKSWQRILGSGIAALVIGALTASVAARHSSAAQVIEMVTGSILLGVGASVLASGIVAQILSRQVFGINVANTVDALRGASKMVRSDQTLDITLTLEGNLVMVLAEHRFDVATPTLRRVRRHFSVYTDVARWSGSGGFTAVLGPDRHTLQGQSLAECVKLVNGKARFEKAYMFFPNTPAEFKVNTFGAFRMTDRLIWTVQQISTDFEVRIINATDLDGRSIKLKVNHHCEDEIAHNIVRDGTAGSEIWDCSFLGEVLPYQGFELQWAFDAEYDAEGEATGSETMS